MTTEKIDKINHDQDDNALICIDLDRTLTKGTAYYPTLPNESIPENIDDAIALIKSHSPLWDACQPKNSKAWLNMIRNGLRKGYKFAITSFNDCPKLVPIVLHLIGLTHKEIEQIYIEAWYQPCRDEGKTKHIQNAMQHFGFTDPKRVVLLDDKEENCAIAREKLGVYAIDVPREKDCDEEHFYQLQVLLHGMNSTLKKIKEMFFNGVNKRSSIDHDLTELRDIITKAQNYQGLYFSLHHYYASTDD